LKLKSGIVIGVPIPEEFAYSHPEELETIIQNALEEAKISGIKGKDITPFLLDKVKTLTGGDSLKSSILHIYIQI
jgi:pseudouridine-5'-phosphate glycosidase